MKLFQRVNEKATIKSKKQVNISKIQMWNSADLTDLFSKSFVSLGDLVPCEPLTTMPNEELTAAQTTAVS